MESIYDQLLDLQHIPHAYTDWADYRQDLTRFILQHSEKGATAIVIGAGVCNDYDLSHLLAHFSTVTLLDRNKQAMLTGLKTQQIQNEEVKTVKADLLGVGDMAYRDMCSRLLSEIRRQVVYQQIQPEALERLFIEQMDEAWKNRQPFDYEKLGSFDYVICCGVHSQLMNLFPQMARVYHQYVKIHLDAIDQEVRVKTSIVVEALNTQLFRLATKGVILGLEQERIGIEGGIEGAAQAINDMQKRRMHPAAEAILLWPFDPLQDKNYRIRVMMIPK